jgi:hypothetical protein
VGDAQDSDATSSGHLTDRFEDPADIGILMAVDRSHVRTNGFDRDQSNIAYEIQFLL